uniref:exodeoxyribonuclease III n=1 Tax=Oreochromis niloticus TaxID=8128 RepID=A0A669F6B0_ORENI
MVLSIFSLNVRGLRNNIKRKAIFLFCKEQPNTNCFLFQETHSSEDDHIFWRKQWGSGDIYLSHGTSHSAGVAIFLHRFNGRVIDHKGDKEGHWLMVNIELDDTKYILVNVYGFNNRAKNRKLISDLEKMIEEWKIIYSIEKVVVAGDFNMVPDEKQDRFPTKYNSPHFNQTIMDFSCTLNLIDIWRKLNPDKLHYTWSNSERSERSRLDYCLITGSLFPLSSNCKILHSPLIPLSVVQSNITTGHTASICLAC